MCVSSTIVVYKAYKCILKSVGPERKRNIWVHGSGWDQSQGADSKLMIPT